MESQRITLRHSQVAFRDSSGAGRPVLLIHGNSCSSRSFERQIANRLSRDHRVLALDLPGHGESGRAADPASDYSLPGYAEVVIGLVNELELDEPVLVGWSLGGHVALQASEHLSNLAGILLFGTPPLRHPFCPEEAFLPHPASSYLFESVLSEEEVRALASAFFRPGAGMIPQQFIEDIEKSDGSARSCLCDRMLAGNYRDEVQILGRLRCPVAIFHGQHDQLVNLNYLRALTFPGLWRGTPQLIAESGHAPHWENAAAFNALLQAFLGGMK